MSQSKSNRSLSTTALTQKVRARRHQQTPQDQPKPSSSSEDESIEPLWTRVALAGIIDDGITSIDVLQDGTVPEDGALSQPRIPASTLGVEGDEISIDNVQPIPKNSMAVADLLVDVVETTEERKRRKKELRNARKGKQPKAQPLSLDHQDAMDQQVSVDGMAPPSSLPPSVDNGTLVDEQPSSKRRKVTFAENQSGPSSSTEPSVAHLLRVEVETPEHDSRLSLPRFPKPTKPEAPSPAALYKQGLDKSMAQAQIVDAAISLPIAAGDMDPVSGPDSLGLSAQTRSRLRDKHISSLFPVQAVLIPFLLEHPTSHLSRSYSPPRDVCISAPTGSGKTLAYVIPIVEILSQRVVTRLRALIVVPTKDVVPQVYDAFEFVAKGRHLKIAAFTGQHSFAHEQSLLVGSPDQRTLKGGSSKIDVLICTPGRLVDHLTDTPNFTLQHLRFLVIDEADKLISRPLQDWLPQVLRAIQPPSSIEPLHRPSTPCDPTQLLPFNDAVAPHWSGILGSRRSLLRTTFDEKPESPCQKLLLSATLTQDPAQIAALKLRNPKYIVVKNVSETATEGDMDMQEGYALPSTLAEHWIAVEPALKPLALFYLIHKLGITNALVFTKSTDSTTRLVRLLNFFEASRTKDQMETDDQNKSIIAKAFSSDLHPKERKALLAQFLAGDIHMLVCSDLVSRGIDLSNVSHVVNYDVPQDIRAYVHRVGRTARAGRSGDAWTLAENQEVRHFKLMMKAHNGWDKLKNVKIDDDGIAQLQPHYQVALAELKKIYG